MTLENYYMYVLHRSQVATICLHLKPNIAVIENLGFHQKRKKTISSDKKKHFK